MFATSGPGALIARMDIMSVFRLLTVHKLDFELLGFKIQDMIFVDKCLPFWCSVSFAKYEVCSTCLLFRVVTEATV